MPSDAHNTIRPTSTVRHPSPFRYPGGKSWWAPLLRRWLTARPRRPQLFVDLFADGGSMGLHAAMEDLADEVLLVELDDGVAAVWRTILGGGADALAAHIESLELTRSTAGRLLADDPASDHHVALRTIVHNRIARNGIIAAGAGIVGHGDNGRGLTSRWYPDTLARRIRAIAGHRHRIHFVQDDALDVLAGIVHDDQAALLIDPPYTASRAQPGQRLYTHADIDHEHLFRLAAAAGDAVLTYDDSPDVHALAASQCFACRGVPMVDGNHRPRRELVIGHDLDWIDTLPSPGRAA